MLKIKRRHIAACTRKSGCGCPLHLHGTIRGQRIRESLGTGSMTVALKMRSAREIEILTGRKVEPVRLSEATEAHGTDIRRRGYAAATLKKYDRLHSDLATAFGGRRVDDISPDDLRRFMGGWSQAPRTQQKQLERLKAFWNFCVDSEWIDRSPARTLRGPKAPPVEKVPLAKGDLAAILAACDAFGRHEWQRRRMKALVLLMRYTGLSIGDAVRLPKMAMQENEIVTRRKKTGEQVRVPFPPVLAEALGSFPHASNEYFFWTGESHPDNVAKMFGDKLRPILKAAGAYIPQATSRRFRQTVGTELAEHGSLEDAQKMLGHANKKTTEQHYAAWTPGRQQGLRAATVRAFGDEARELEGSFGSSLTHGREPRVN